MGGLHRLLQWVSSLTHIHHMEYHGFTFLDRLAEGWARTGALDTIFV